LRKKRKGKKKKVCTKTKEEKVQGNLERRRNMREKEARLPDAQKKKKKIDGLEKKKGDNFTIPEKERKNERPTNPNPIKILLEEGGRKKGIRTIWEEMQWEGGRDFPSPKRNNAPGRGRMERRHAEQVSLG